MQILITDIFFIKLYTDLQRLRRVFSFALLAFVQLLTRPESLSSLVFIIIIVRVYLNSCG